MPKGHSVYHYATVEDYALIFRDVVGLHLGFVVNEARVDPDFQIYADPLTVPGFGASRWANGSSMDFVVIASDDDVPYEYRESRTVPQKYGFFSPPVDYRHVYFTASAMYLAGPSQGLLQGWLRTNSENPASLDIFGALKKAIRTHSERIKTSYVAPGAAQYLDQGGRLSDDLQRPTAFDLKRD